MSPRLDRVAAAVSPDDRPESKARLYEEFAQGGKALANGKRLELLDLLAQGERTVESLAGAAGLNLTTVSANLQTLKQAGFVATRREGVRVHYRLAGQDVAQLLVLLRKVTAAHNTRVRPARDQYLSGAADATDPPEISRADLQRRVSEGTVLLLDVRPAEEFAAGHIPGARSIPIGELAERLQELPADTEAVVYCRDEYCVMAYDALRVLLAAGRRALRLHDGMLEWRLDDLPIEVPAT